MATQMSANSKMLPAVETFVEQVRTLFREGGEEREIWTKACDYLRDLLADDDLSHHFAWVAKQRERQSP